MNHLKSAILVVGFERCIKLAFNCAWILLIGVLLAPLSVLMAQTQETTMKAFVNVNIVPMNIEQVLLDQTVIINGEEIYTVGPSTEVRVPLGTEIIEGNGAYLLPGLADMHTHLNVDSSPDFMRLFLAEGVTTIRNLNALPSHLNWRNDVISGKRIGPTIYNSGPVIAGPPDLTIVWTFWVLIVGGLLAVGVVLWINLWLLRRLCGQKKKARIRWKSILMSMTILVIFGSVLIWKKVIPINIYTSQEFPWAYVPDTEERARVEVKRQKEAGYDLIKVYDYMNRDQYLGAIDEAQTQGIYIIGHLDHGLEVPLATGLREVAHVDEFMDVHLIGEISPRAFEPVPLDYKLIPQSVLSVVEHDALVVSNMITDVITYEYLEEGPSYFERPEYTRFRPKTIEDWLDSRMVNWQGQQEWRRNTVQPFLEEMIRSLHAAGVPILTGTDTGVEGGLPEHIHRELELLVKAGLSPYEVLNTATKNACLSINRMGVDDSFGEVAAGHRADLILLETNPLDDIRATRRRLGVMSRGHWYTQAVLDELVAEMVATY